MKALGYKLTIPSFESVAILSDDAHAAAEISSFFRRPGLYLPVMDGPRMGRTDWTNEIIRRANALAMARSRRVILVNLPSDAVEQLCKQCPSQRPTSVVSSVEAEEALKGWTKAPDEELLWGSTNLGVGLLHARRSKKRLKITLAASPETNFVPGGTHLLLAVEEGNELAHIIAANLAFATGSSFVTFPELSEEHRQDWLEEIYAIGSGGSASEKLAEMRARARPLLPDIDFGAYKQVLFITNGFPWSIASPDCAATHMFAYPDLGRSVIEGLWVAHRPSASARTALLIQPQQNIGSEIEAIAESLKRNRTLVRAHIGPHATVHHIDTLVQTVPFDIIVLSTHAGDVGGERITYEFKDSEGIHRRLVIDEAVGFGYDPKTEKVQVHQFQRFHELDGVEWADSAAKARMNVGTAITSWVALGDMIERNRFRVKSVKIDRVIGSMALQMHDHVWIPMIHGFPPTSCPMILNNACSSWHELSKRFMYAGARAYIGTLFPITEGEAQAVGSSLFQKEIGSLLPDALWNSQNRVYEGQERRPYAMVGLPFCSVGVNTIDSVSYLASEYRKGIEDCDRKARNTDSDELRQTFLRFKTFLMEDLQKFTRHFETPLS